jgi:hypothetical protein
MELPDHSDALPSEQSFRDGLEQGRMSHLAVTRKHRKPWAKIKVNRLSCKTNSNFLCII